MQRPQAEQHHAAALRRQCRKRLAGCRRLLPLLLPPLLLLWAVASCVEAQQGTHGRRGPAARLVAARGARQQRRGDAAEQWLRAEGSLAAGPQQLRELHRVQAGQPPGRCPLLRRPRPLLARLLLLLLLLLARLLLLRRLLLLLLPLLRPLLLLHQHFDGC